MVVILPFKAQLKAIVQVEVVVEVEMMERMVEMPNLVAEAGVEVDLLLLPAILVEAHYSVLEAEVVVDTVQATTQELLAVRGVRIRQVVVAQEAPLLERLVHPVTMAAAMVVVEVRVKVVLDGMVELVERQVVAGVGVAGVVLVMEVPALEAKSASGQGDKSKKFND
jgi:hypothetical protein